ncbi:hypothetical protein NPIL_508781 [Nephila pilipes]|uniref:Uncharacterized protein n=1 Tax=Nephila pilipes TaxID=299642 RepID=A0A8X6PE39_NEPPI|nr:hypothetical protein NPIL_508781 [Nephila pilipes]
MRGAQRCAYGCSYAAKMTGHGKQVLRRMAASAYAYVYGIATVRGARARSMHVYSGFCMKRRRLRGTAFGCSVLVTYQRCGGGHACARQVRVYGQKCSQIS